MKLVILTSDILDGLVISQKIIRSGKDVRAIIYEKKPFALKPYLKRLLFCFKGVLGHISYQSMRKEKPGMMVKEVDSINDESIRFLLGHLLPDLMVVIGTRKIKKNIFSKAKTGTINMHSGILPYYRGADSEFWALYNKEIDKIGVTIHFVDDGLDSGDIVLCARQNVEPTDDYKSLRMKNILLGAEKMVEAIEMIEGSRYERIKQDSTKAVTYKSATKEKVREYNKRVCNVG